MTRHCNSDVIIHYGGQISEGIQLCIYLIILEYLQLVMYCTEIC